MKSIISIILMSFENEFSKVSNIFGWSFTTSVLLNSAQLEKINLMLTILLTLASLIWVILKITLAIKNYKSGSSK